MVQNGFPDRGWTVPEARLKPATQPEQIAYPVEEITIAANLRDMFAGIVAVGAAGAFRRA